MSRIELELIEFSSNSLFIAIAGFSASMEAGYVTRDLSSLHRQVLLSNRKASWGYLEITENKKEKERLG